MAPFPDPLTTLQDHAAFVRAVARRLVADPSDVDDLVQESYARLIKTLSLSIWCVVSTLSPGHALAIAS